MKNFHIATCLLLLLLACLLSGSPESGAVADAELPYKDPSLPIEKRVDDLVSRMMLEEKVSQMMNAAPAIPRLDIPEYEWWNEGLHGVARAGYATVFPQAIGLAATWDTNLMAQVTERQIDEAVSAARQAD
jgi:beta-glucosidase